MTARARAHRRVRRAGDSCLELGDGALTWVFRMPTQHSIPHRPWSWRGLAAAW